MTQVSTDDEFDDELIADYREGFSDHYEIIINCIATLESAPNSDETINELFRALHTVKGNARMLMFEQLANFLHSVEEGVSALRDHRIQFTELLGEAITLCLDKAKEMSEDIFTHTITDDPSIEIIQNIFLELQSSEQQNVNPVCATIIKEITGFDIDTICNQSEIDSILQEIEISNIQQSDITRNRFNTEMAQEMILYISEDTPENLKEHLGYMRYLALLLEAKLPHWTGRTFQLLQLLSMFNKALEYPVKSYQLEMASYVHDMSYSFLPESLMRTTKKFTPEEFDLMKTHSQVSADFICMNKEWETAHDIILQHHEKSNGTGYPYGLIEEEICVGAKMLSIVDAFIAMTAYRPDRSYKRSILTALNEIKTQAGKQFSAELVPTFINIVVSQLK